jgi:hypothetical protein
VKRTFVAVFVLASVVSRCGVSTAHEIGARVDLPSKFERFVVPPGGVRFLQFYGIGQIEGPDGTVRFRVGRVAAAGQTTALLALEVRVSSTSGSSRATHTGFVDADDLDSLVRALKEMDLMLKKRLFLTKAETVEAEFATGSVRIGAVLTNRSGDHDRLLIGAGNPSRVTAAFDPADLPMLRVFVSKAIEAIEKISEVADSNK